MPRLSDSEIRRQDPRFILIVEIVAIHPELHDHRLLLTFDRISHLSNEALSDQKSVHTLQRNLTAKPSAGNAAPVGTDPALRSPIDKFPSAVAALPEQRSGWRGECPAEVEEGGEDCHWGHCWLCLEVGAWRKVEFLLREEDS